MIEYDGPYLTIHCDNCPYADSRDADDFSFVGFVQEMHRAGWVSIINDETDEWEHFCPDCIANREHEEFRAFTPKQRSNR